MRRARITAVLPGFCVAGLMVLIGTAARGDNATSAPAGTKRAIVICGLPGDDDHRKLYADAVELIRKGLVERLGFPKSEVRVRFGTESRSGDGPALAEGRGLSSREGIAADAAEIRKQMTPDDTLWVIVVGHGHLDGRHAFLNLPGPDLSDSDFGKLFEGIKAREQVFFLTTSSSGFFLKPLSAPGRVVITATEADQEVNETLFPLALADALATAPEDADRDKNGELSLLEFYLAVVTDIFQRYIDEENLPTEHARLDDNGDGHGSELQLRFLPPEILGTEVKKDAAAEKKKKEKPAEKKAEPVIGPKDDGALAAKIRVEVLSTEKPKSEANR